MEIPKEIKKIMQKLVDNNFSVEIIGGAVRDYLLGVKPHDYDLFTNATGEDILKIFPQGKVLGGKERQKKILTVIVDGVEVSQYRASGDRSVTGTDFEQHIKSCDFTINAIACNIDGEIIDLVGGINHLKIGLLCFVGDGNVRVAEDENRINRFVRIGVSKHFDYNLKSLNAIRDNLDLLDNVAGEIILEELKKIMQYSNAIIDLKYTHILYKLFPEFELVKDMDGGDKHDEPVGQHLEEAFKIACTISDDFKLRFATLFHDIGKGSTKNIINGEVTKGNRTTFYSHEYVSEKIFLKYADKYKFSNNETKFISFLIKNHMFGYNAENINNNTLVKFFNKMEDAGVNILDFVSMMYCDNQGNLAKPRIKFKEFIENNFFYNKYHNIKRSLPFNVKDLEISGNDLIKLGYIGKDIGINLNKLFERVIDGELINRKDRLLEAIMSKR